MEPRGGWGGFCDFLQLNTDTELQNINAERLTLTSNPL